MDTASIKRLLDGKKKIIFGIAAVIVLAVFCLVPIGGMEQMAQLSLGFLLFVILLWVGDVIPMAMATLLYLALLVIAGVVKFGTAFSGFTSLNFFLILGAFFVAAAMEKSGLAVRIAYFFAKLGRGNYTLTVLGIYIASFIIGAVIPSSIVRASIFLPLLVGLFEVYDAKPGSKLAANMQWQTYFAVVQGSMYALPAININNIAAGFLTQLTGYEFTWLSWAGYNIIPALIWIPIMLFGVNFFIRPEKELTQINTGAYLDKQFKELGPVKPIEKKMGVWFVIVMAAYIGLSVVGANMGATALVLGALMFAPKIGLLSNADVKSINWNTVIFVGATLGISAIMSDTGLSEMLIDSVLTPALSFFASVGHLAFGWAYSILYCLINFVIPSGTSEVSILGPLVLEFAVNNGIDPVYTTLLLGNTGPILSGFLPYTILPMLALWPAGGIRGNVDTVKTSVLTLIPRAIAITAWMIIWCLMLGISI